MKKLLLFLVLLNWICSGYASNEKSLVILIPKTFYDHPIRLMQPRVDQWHNRGIQAENAAMKLFTSNQYAVSNCNSDANGKLLVVILPSMFYSAQNGIFYSEVNAKIYKHHDVDDASLKASLDITSQGKVNGWLAANDEMFTFQSYQNAFNELIKKLQSNIDFQKMINETSRADLKAMCEHVERLTESTP